MKEKKIAVIGLGPAGGILATHLASVGHIIYGVDVWKEHTDKTREKGLEIKSTTPLNSQLYRTFTYPEELRELTLDYVVLAVKTPKMQEVISVIRNFPGEFQILVLQNGFDNEQDLIPFFPKERILRATVNYAGNIVEPGVIKMNFFAKPNQIGCICNQANCTHGDELAQIMTEAGLATETVADIRKYTLRKVILHAILAPVSAILGITMADVMEKKESRAIVESLIIECISVAKAMGYDYGDDFFGYCMNFLLNAGKHKPSMLIDLEKGNPTEIDYIGSKIVAFGDKFNIPIPVITTITRLVKAKEFYFCK